MLNVWNGNVGSSSATLPTPAMSLYRSLLAMSSIMGLPCPSAHRYRISFE